MWLHDHANYAVRDTDVDGFTLEDSVINGANGTDPSSPYFDSSIRFYDLTGAVGVSTSAISGCRRDNVRIVNTAGALDRITFTTVTIGDNHATDGNDRILLETASSAGALKVTITDSVFTGAGGDLLQVNHSGAGSGDLVLTDNTFSNSHASIATGGGGLTLYQGGQAGNYTTMTITGNSFRDSVGTAVLVVNAIGPASQTGTFSDNTIGVAGAGSSGSVGDQGSSCRAPMSATRPGWSATTRSGATTTSGSRRLPAASAAPPPG